jgi:hypothetical protein
VERRWAGWLNQRTEAMLDELELLGLNAPKADLARMIQRALAEVAATAGISEVSARRYLDDERLRSLAQEVALGLAEERPGAELHQQARTIPLSLQLLGRVITALAEATRIRVLNADEAGAGQTLELVSFLGQILHEAPHGASDPLHLPQATLARAARLLEASAEVIEVGGNFPRGLPTGADHALVKAFHADAPNLRTLVSEHGADAGPTPNS